jgi:large subunit ribosomal protein L13Ae
MLLICCACRVLRLQPGHKYCLLGELSKEVGWNYSDTIRVSFPLISRIVVP